MISGLSAAPTITVDFVPLLPNIAPYIERVVVDDHLRLPDTFSITFRDAKRDILDKTRIRIGSLVTISGTAMGQPGALPLISGEVTALEGEYEHDGARLVVRGYDQMHRLRAGKRTETYRFMTDADICRKIVLAAGVPPGLIEPTLTLHEHISQANESDYDFLARRAKENGFDLGIENGLFYFKRPANAALGPMEGNLQVGTPTQLVMGSSLLSFFPRVTAAQQVSEVEVRGWDPMNKEAIVATAKAGTTSAQLQDKPDDLASVSGNGRTVVAAAEFPMQISAEEAAKAEAERMGSSFAEAEGVARGHPQLKAGTAISITGVADPFAGKYVLSQTRHIFDQDGYRTNFTVAGRQDRSLLGLTSGGNGSGQKLNAEPGQNGVMVAIVTDNLDPMQLGRVKLKFPSLDDSYESHWARVVQDGAGPDRGMVILPEVNDEVLVAFEAGDIRRPYVIGGLYNGKDKPNLGGLDIFQLGKVTRRGFISSKNHRLVFLDSDLKSGVSLATGDGGMRLALKETDKAITMHSDGTITISSNGKIEIESVADVSIKAGKNLSLEAKAGVKVKSDGIVDIDGSLIQLN
jgi:uncharacterized protein involved in type VI secretion and phage assembly